MSIFTKKIKTMKKILVTGGLGYIGSHTIIFLLEKGYIPVVIDNLSNSHIEIKDNIEKISNKQLSFYNVDLLETNSCINLLKNEGEFVGAIHFAALKSVSESFEKPDEYYRNNVQGVESLLKIMQELKIKNLIFSSSCAVYGNVSQFPVNEKSLSIEPLTPYGVTKKRGEELILNYSKIHDLSSIALRYFNPIGAHESGMIGEYPIGKPHNLMPFITQTAIGDRECLEVFGDNYDTKDGSCVRDYIHVTDLAEIHILALEYIISNPISYNNFFNVGTGKGVSTFELIETFEKINKVKIPKKISSKRKGDIPMVYADATKAMDFFKWKPKKTVEDAVKSAWKWEQFKKFNMQIDN